MKFKLYWNGEVVDQTDNYDSALFLLNEYNMAFGGGVTISNNGVTLMVSYD